jgi:hypothetical protein
MIKTRFPGMATGIDLASDLVRLIRHGVGAEGAEDTPYPEHALSALAQILPSGQRREMKFIP